MDFKEFKTTPLTGLFVFMLFLSDVSAAVGLTLMKWVYTDQAEIPNDETFLIELVKTAQKYRLKELKERYVRSALS